LALVAAIFVIINLPSTKQWAADQALQIVNQDFKAQMSTESVEVNFFGDVTIKGLKVKDYKGYDFIQPKNLLPIPTGFLWLQYFQKQFFKLQFPYFKNADVKVITYKGDSISNFIDLHNSLTAEKKRSQ
jgi:hypothetical protein